MLSELQRLAETLGRNLHRSVAIDDPEIRLLAYSSHVGDVDEVRRRSIMSRHVPAELVAYIMGQGVDTERLRFTLPARPDLGLDVDRIGVPIRNQGLLAGIIWLLASEGAVTEEDESALVHAAENASIIMHREYLLGELSRGRERELTRDLLSEAPQVRSTASELLVADRVFSSAPVAAVVVNLNGDGSGLGDRDRLALAAGLEHARRHAADRHLLTLERPDHGIVIVTHPGRGDAPLVSLATSLREQVLEQSSDGVSCWVGIGTVRDRLLDAHLSYVEARRAAGVASVVGVLGSVVRYADLGVYGLLAELPTDRLLDSLPPGLRVLLERRGPGDDSFVRTLEVFLDNAGDVKRTTDDLHIHRTTLYYRLRRIQEITGMDLTAGDDRLAIHLGLRITRLLEGA